MNTSDRKPSGDGDLPGELKGLLRELSQARESFQTDDIRQLAGELRRMIRQLEGNGQPGMIKTVFKLEERCQFMAEEVDRLAGDVQKHGDWISNSGWRLAGMIAGWLVALGVGLTALMK